MKRTIVPLLAAVLFATPAAAEIVVRNIDLSIGIGSPRYEPKREVVYVDRKPDVVVVRDHDDHRDHDHGYRDHDRGYRDHDRWDRRHNRRHHRDEWRERRREEPKVIVIDRDRRGHRCDDRGRVVVARPGSTVVLAGDRRW